MSLRALGNHLILAALLAALVTASGCGKDNPPPTAPHVVVDKFNVATQDQANQVASRVADEYRVTTALEYARSLFSPVANGAGGARARSARPSRTGVVAQDDGRYTYQIQAFDAAGNRVPWDSTPWEQIQRVVIDWNMAWDWSSTDSPSYSRGHSAGTMDVSGFLPTSTEVTFSGSSRDTSDYRWLIGNYDLSGSGISVVGIEGLRWSKDWTTNPYPLAGRESMFVDQRWSYSDGSTHDAEHVKADVVIVYNGTQYADLIVDGRYHYRLDLESGTAEPDPA